jgi:hypothetical protein
MRRFAPAFVAILGSAGLVLFAQEPQPPRAAAPVPRATATTAAPGEPARLESTLDAAKRYLAGYGRALSSLTAEEAYAQDFTAAVDRKRRLRSDVLFFVDGLQWSAFRDVFDADGQPVRGRDDRLVTVFGNGSSGAREQAQRIAAESARFNLNVPGISVDRTLNVPITALLFFLDGNQHRSRFKSEGSETVDGKRLTVVGFDEHTRPRLIASRDNVPMNGDAWIDPISGEILRTDLSYVTSGDVRGLRGMSRIQTTATITVRFAGDTQLGLVVPVSMDERYETIEMPGAYTGISIGPPPSPLVGTLTGHAVYSNFRRSGVSVGTAIQR